MYFIVWIFYPSKKDVLSRSVMSDSETVWTAAHQAPLSIGIL